MQQAVGTKELAALYNEAAQNRNEALQGLILEAVQQLSIAEGAEAFVSEAARLIADEISVGETAAIEASKASSHQAGEFNVVEAVAVEAAEALSIQTAIAEATAIEAMEATQTMHEFIRQVGVQTPPSA